MKSIVSILFLLFLGFLAQPKAQGGSLEVEEVVIKEQAATEGLNLLQAEVDQQDCRPLRRRRVQRLSAAVPYFTESSLPNLVACDFYSKLHIQLKSNKYLAGPDISVYRLTPF